MMLRVSKFFIFYFWWVSAPRAETPYFFFGNIKYKVLNCLKNLDFFYL